MRNVKCLSDDSWVHSKQSIDGLIKPAMDEFDEEQVQPATIILLLEKSLEKSFVREKESQAAIFFFNAHHVLSIVLHHRRWIIIL